MSRSIRTDERGSTTMVTAIIICFLATVLMVAVTLITTTISSHKARNAADIAAVTGAAAVFQGDNACAEAAAIALANHATLTHCHVEGADVVVTVEVGSSQATAKAGPI